MSAPAIPVLLFPFGGNAREALPSLTAIHRGSPTYEVLGFVDDNTAVHGKTCCGVPVLGGREVLARHPEARVLAVPGSPTSFPRRLEVIAALGLARERFPTILHPSVIVAADAELGVNVLLMQGGTISVGARVEDHCVVLPGTVISHDAVVGEGTLVGSNVSISGGVRIGRGCYLGSGTAIRDGVRIGDGSLIGLGSVVVRDVPPGVVVAGSPARVLRPVQVD